MNKADDVTFLFSFQDHTLTPEIRRELLIAENASLCSEIYGWRFLDPGDARGSIALLITCYLVFHTRAGLEYREVYRKLANRAYHYAYQGDWGILQSFLEQKPRSLNELVKMIRSQFSDYDIFGNLCPLIRRILGSARKYKLYNRVYRQRVNYPQRKRGYNDKGSLRQTSRWLPRCGMPESQREDRRHLAEFIPRNSHFWIDEYKYKLAAE